MAEQQALLTEYQTCQYHIQTIDMRLWQSAAILIGASFASLAVLSREEASMALCVGVGLASLGAATVFGLWTRIWRRRDASVHALEARMREIEWKTGMRKVIYFSVLRRWTGRAETEEWRRLTEEERSELAEHYQPLPRPAASSMLYVTALIALAGWPALFVGKAIELALD